MVRHLLKKEKTEREREIKKRNIWQNHDAATSVGGHFTAISSHFPIIVLYLHRTEIWNPIVYNSSTYDHISAMLARLLR